MTTSALPDLILGASLYFPPLFKAVLLGLLGWLPVHHLLRDWLYGGDVWHPLLMDLSLFILAVSGAYGYCYMAKSPLATLKYFSTLLVCALALAAGWWLWNYYMQGPWTRDGKVRAELVSITPEVSGKIIKIAVKDNQLVKAGEEIFTLDPEPYRIALDNAQAALAKAKSDFDKAEHEANRRSGLSRSVISAEAVDEARLNAQAMKAAYQVAQANLEQARWSLAKTRVHAASDGYITNLQTRVGNYASAGVPLVALVDIHSFYVQGYFEETKLRHIAPGKPAEVVLYSGEQRLRGEVESIGRAIYDQSVEGADNLLLDVKPNVPWVRLAQRVPVRIKLLEVPPGLTLIAGTTCTITIGSKVAASLWRQTPWGKANGGQWRYALRNSLAMCLSLWLAFVLELDSPYWAMTSAAVVSFPTVGGVISKSLGRVVGSLIGAMAAVVITGLGISDPWLFSFLIALWLALCTYISNHHQNNVSYAFALAGYTAAIIAFSCVNVTDPQHIFDIAQARVSEVIIGILCGGLLMMILPSTSDGETLLQSLHKTQARLLEHAQLLWLGEASPEVRTAHEGLIGQILTMNVLRIQAVWSHHRLRRHNRLLNFLLHRQLRLISLISSQRRMLHNWPTQPEGLQALLERLLAELGQPGCDKYRIARLLAPLVPTAASDYRLHTFWRRLRHFCWSYLECQRWLDRLARYDDQEWPAPPRHSSLTSHTDTLEAAYNGGRTFLCVLLGCAFWIHSQWDAGSSALTLLSICCVLYSATPAPAKGANTMLKAILLLSLICFAVKFGLMIRLDDFWLFCALLFPMLITMQLFKQQQPRQAVLWGQLIVLLGSFLAITNPPSYDYLQYINGSLGQALGVMSAGLAFQLLRPSSDRRKSRRLIRSLRRHFMDQLEPAPRQSESQFESLIYHCISQLSQSQDQTARLWVLRWGVVLLNCSHIVWQLRQWRGEEQPLYLVRDNCIRSLQGILTEQGVQHASLGRTLAELQRISAALANHREPTARELAGMVWRLHSSLSQLQQALPVAAEAR